MLEDLLEASPEARIARAKRSAYHLACCAKWFWQHDVRL